MSITVLDGNGAPQTVNTLNDLLALLPAALGANGGLKIEGVASGTAVPISGTVTTSISGVATEAKQDTQITHLSSAATSLGVMDDWDESDRAKVNVIVGQAGVAAGVGAVGATVQRMTLASDDPAVSSLTSILAKIIAAPATEAKQDTGNTSLASAVTALQIMDDWDESDRAKVNIIAGQVGVAAGSGTVSALTQRVVLATDVALPAGENHIGQVGSPLDIVDVTFTPDTSVLATGDIAADTQIITNAMRVNDGKGLLQSLVIFDDDDQGLAFDVVIFSANQSLGTENAAPSISDANSHTILGSVSIAAADFIDLGGVRFANIKNIGMIVKAASGTRNLYAGIIARGAPTYTGSGILGRFGFVNG